MDINVGASWPTDIFGGGCGHTKRCRKISKIIQIVMNMILDEDYPYIALVTETKRKRGRAET